jgi:hypothetical protein
VIQYIFFIRPLKYCFSSFSLMGKAHPPCRSIKSVLPRDCRLCDIAGEEALRRCLEAADTDIRVANVRLVTRFRLVAHIRIVTNFHIVAHFGIADQGTRGAAHQVQDLDETEPEMYLQPGLLLGREDIRANVRHTDMRHTDIRTGMADASFAD